MDIKKSRSVKADQSESTRVSTLLMVKKKIPECVLWWSSGFGFCRSQQPCLPHVMILRSQWRSILHKPHGHTFVPKQMFWANEDHLGGIRGFRRVAGLWFGVDMFTQRWNEKPAGFCVVFFSTAIMKFYRRQKCNHNDIHTAATAEMPHDQQGLH